MTQHEAPAFALRRGTKADMPWLYDIFKRTMQEFIENTWGWDELMQSHSFADLLPANTFLIAVSDQIDIAALIVREKPDHLWLEMALVLPKYQSQGYGSALIKHAQALASKAQKPLRLSVLKLNPAQEFYHKMGFEIFGSDQWSLKLQWSPPS